MKIGTGMTYHKSGKVMFTTLTSLISLRLKERAFQYYQKRH